jgi:exonuclease-1
MGIQGLLPTLKSVMTPRHVRDYAGKRAAIDTYSWLHKAAFSCSKDLCQGRPNDK